MACTTDRKSVARGRPIPAGGGIKGASTAHSASVVLLAKTSLSRRYCRGVIPGQGIVTSIESWHIRRNHSSLGSLTTYGPYSEERPQAASRRMEADDDDPTMQRGTARSGSRTLP